MGIWNEIQEQLKELQQLLDERKQLDEIYNQLKNQNDRITDPKHSLTPSDCISEHKTGYIR